MSLILAPVGAVAQSTSEPVPSAIQDTQSLASPGSFVTYHVDVPCATPRRHAPAARRHPVRHVIIHHMTTAPIRRTVMRHPRSLAEMVHPHAQPVRCEVIRHAPIGVPAVAYSTPSPELVGIAVPSAGLDPAPRIAVSSAFPLGPAPIAGAPGFPALDARPTRSEVTPPPVTAAPEPSQWSLMIFGVAMCGLGLRRRRAMAAVRA